MTCRTLRRALLPALAVTALAPTVAAASTWTVDDDKAQCPNAGFTTIQAAVDQAAPHDTVVICPGLYQEASTPDNSNFSPAQPGSRNGLTIAKPLTIRGAGASKVIIEPAPVLGSSLAGTSPYLRDGGGNVISVLRQSLGSTDADENRVDISGVTVRSPNAYAEAGVAFFNTSGSITDSVIGPLRRAAADTELSSRPHGWGVVQTNSLTGGSSGSPRREVSLVDSLVTGYQAGGILFDDAGGADGAATNTTRSGINMYGYVRGTRVVGGGASTGFLQTGVAYRMGARGAVSGSEILNNAATSTSGSPPVTSRSSGLLLSDADLGADPINPAANAFQATATSFGQNAVGLTNATSDGATARTDATAIATGNWWGCTAGALAGAPSNANSGCQGTQGNVDSSSPLTSTPTGLAVPGVTEDDAPSARFVDPADGVTVAAGQTVLPVVAASDDFGIRSVDLAVDGQKVATIGHTPYEFGWTPAAADAGRTVTLTATAVDSSGQTTIATMHVKVAGGAAPSPAPPAALPVPSNTALPAISGDVKVGGTAACAPGAWSGDPTSFAFQWARAGKPIAGATGATYRIPEADTASTITCRVTAANATGPGTAAESAPALVSRASATTAGSLMEQIGPSIATLLRKVAVSASTGRASAGELACVRASATRCALTAGGTLRAGGHSYRLSWKTTVKQGRTARISLPVPSAARRALRKAGGTLSLKLGVTDDHGFAGSRTVALTVKRLK